MNSTTEPTTTVCHLNPCQVDICHEAASHRIVIPEPGMYMPAADLMACEWHTASMIDNGEAEGIGPIA